jgi:hypothetical protein
MIECDLVELGPGIDQRKQAKEINQVLPFLKDPGNQYPDIQIYSSDQAHMKKGSIDIIDFFHPVRGGKEIHQENIGNCPEQDMLQCPVPGQFQKKPSNAFNDHPGHDRYGFIWLI